MEEAFHHKVYGGVGCWEKAFHGVSIAGDGAEYPC